MDIENARLLFLQSRSPVFTKGLLLDEQAMNQQQSLTLVTSTEKQKEIKKRDESN